MPQTKDPNAAIPPSATRPYLHIDRTGVFGVFMVRSLFAVCASEASNFVSVDVATDSFPTLGGSKTLLSETIILYKQ